MLMTTRVLISGILFVIAFVLFQPTMGKSQSQPIVVLEYPDWNNKIPKYSDNAFVQNFDYSTTHKVQQDETLSHILENYYSGSGLNMRFIEMAIVANNRHAFAKNNPNFLFADKMLKLPSLNQIQAMLLGDNAPESLQKPNPGIARNQEIYFIGG